MSIEGYLLTHTGIRRHLANFEGQAERLNNITAVNAGKLQKWFQLYWQIVEHHHLAEDNNAFVLVSGRDPNFAAKLDMLIDEHHVIDDLVEKINERLDQVQNTVEDSQAEVAYNEFVKLVNQMRQTMFDHLDKEEAAYIPAITGYFSEEEQNALEEEIFKEMGFDHLALLFPWVLDILKGQEYELAYAGLPAPFKDLYDNSWRQQYAQITATFAIN